MHRIVARPLVLEEGLPVLHVPFRIALLVGLVLLVAVADGVAVIDRKRRPAVLLVALILIVAHDDQRIERCSAQPLLQVCDGRARDVLAGDQMLGRHHVRKLRVGLFEQVAIGDRPALLVVMADFLVGLDEARKRLIRGKQHGRVRRSQAEHDLGHRMLLTGSPDGAQRNPGAAVPQRRASTYCTAAPGLCFPSSGLQRD